MPSLFEKIKAKYRLVKGRQAYIQAQLRAAKMQYELSMEPAFEIHRVLADLIRDTHSIEKGLSIKNPRKGFGVEKIERIFKRIATYEELGGHPGDEAVLMACDVLHQYICWHLEADYSSDELTKIMDQYRRLSESVPAHKQSYGGVTDIDRAQLDAEIDFKAFQRVVLSRHSVREFSQEPVSRDKLERAVELATYCPSACNRQGVRLYVLRKDKHALIKDWLEGIGGFDGEIDTFLLITGIRSAYRVNEEGQYVVSASIFAGYLSLTLHACGLGSCLIQRPVLWSDKWITLARELGIPEDEQIVCVLGAGNLEERFRVPVSHRLPLDWYMQYL